MVTTVSPVISSSEYNREQQERATESFEANAFRKQASNISVTDEPDPIHTLSGHEPSCRKQDSDFLSLFDGFHKIFSCAPTYFQAQIDTDEETVSTQSEVESIEDTVSEVTPDRAELESIFSAYELEDYGHEQTFVNIINAMFHNVSNSTKVDISGEEEIQVHLLNLKLLSEDLKQSSTYHNTAFIQSLERSIKFIHYEYESDEEKLESMIAELTSPKDFIAFVNRTDGHAIGELIIKNPNVELGEKEYLKISINKGYGGCPNHNYTYQDFTKKELSNILEYPKDGHYHKKLPLLGKDQIVGNCLFIALFEAVKLAASLQTKAFRAQLFNSQNNWFFLPKNNPQTIHAEFKEHSKVDGEPLKLRFPLLYGQHLEQQEDFEGASNLAHLKEVIVKNKRLRNQKTTYYLPTLFREHPDTNFKTIATIVTEGRQNFRQPHNTDSSSQNAEGSPHKANFRAIQESNLYDRGSIMTEYLKHVAMEDLNYLDRLDLLYDITISEGFSQDKEIQSAVFEVFLSLDTPVEVAIKGEPLSTNKIKRPDSIQRKENYIAAKMSKLRDDEDQTLLQRAIMKNENSEVTNILIRNFSNADMNYRSRDGVSTLQMAIQEGDANLFKELIDHGINTNGDSFDPSPALDVYIYYGECIEILKMLIDICPDINKKNHFGLTPHDVAIQQSDIATALILEHNGAIPTYASVQSEDVIESLLRHSNTGLIEGLLDQGCTLNIGADEQKTALHLYCTKGLRRPEVLKLLLTHSPEINKKNHDGLTAHDIAIQYGDLETADYIKQHGAKPPVISYFQEAMQSVFG